MRKRSIEHLRKGHAVLARSHGGAKFTGSEGIGRRHDVPGARSSSQKIAAAAVELAPSEVCVLVRELVVRIETRLHTASVKILKTACAWPEYSISCMSFEVQMRDPDTSDCPRLLSPASFLSVSRVVGTRRWSVVCSSI